jgi:hypothetical protein
LNIVKVISTDLDNAKKRLVKFLRFGKSDVQTSIEANPYGLDSNPIKDMVAVYSETSGKGETVIVGYLNKNLKAGVGEFRTFSTDANGNEKFYIWQKNDGNCEFGGTVDNMVRYQKLSDAMLQFQNKLIVQLNLISTGIAAGGGSYVVGDVSIDISQSKINEIKTL